MSTTKLQKDEVFLTDSPVVPNLYDVRLRMRNLSRGYVKNDELKKYLTSLPDESENCVVTTFGEVIQKEEA